MEVFIKKENRNELTLDIKNERHSFCSMLQRELIENRNIISAGYDSPHPLIRSSIMYIRTTKNKKPREELLSTLDKCSNKLEHFITKFEEAWNNTEKI